MISKESDEARGEIFHSITVKLLFIMKRARLDVETAVSYLITRVSKKHEKDWEKLNRFLGFMKGSIKDHRVIEVDSLHDLHV